MKVVKVAISELKPSEYNPRQASPKECEDLKKSIQEFGLVDPIIVNSAKEHKGIKVKCFGCREEFIKYGNLKSKRHFHRKCWYKFCAENLGEWTKSEKTSERNKEIGFKKKVSNGLKKYYQKCQLDFLQGKRTDWRVSTWKGIRQIILKRYNFQCLRCKENSQLHIHHIIPERAGGKNILKNLLPLCSKCHQFIEKNQLGIFEIVKDWNITAILMRDSFLLNI